MVSLTIHGVKSALGSDGSWWDQSMLALEAQLEPTALRNISRFVAFPSLHNFMGTVTSKTCRNIKIGVHIVPLTGFSAELTSSGVCATDDDEFKASFVYGEKHWECLHGLFSTELKWELMHISHYCLACIILTFFAGGEKEMRNWATLLHFFPYFSDLSYNLISSTVGSILFPAESYVSYCHSTFKELKNTFWYFKTSDISSSFPHLCWQQLKLVLDKAYIKSGHGLTSKVQSH